MLPNVDMIFLNYIASKEDVELVDLCAGFFDCFVLEVELHLEIVVEVAGLLVLDVQFAEEHTLHEVGYLISFLSLYVFPQFGCYQVVDTLVQSQDDRFLLADDSLMSSVMEGRYHYHIVLLLYDCPLPALVLNCPNVNYP